MSRSNLHLGAWFAYFTIEILRYAFFSEFNNPIFIISRLAVTISIKAALFYLIYSHYAPRFAFAKKWRFFALSVVWSIVIFSFFNSLSYYFFQIWLGQNSWDYSYLIYFSLDAFVIIAIGLLAAYATRHQAQEKQLLNLKKERSQERLRVLQAQVNPHFLFNTLNNIYSLALHNSKKTASAIQQLAAVMRYIFEQSDASKVSIKDEIEAVCNLLEIGSLAAEAGFSMNTSVSYDRNYEVVPLCLVPLIENFIKHGDLSDQGFLNLEINAVNEKLNLKMENAIAEKMKLNNHMTGLVNLRNRLELTYRDNFELSYGELENERIFTLELTIQL